MNFVYFILHLGCVRERESDKIIKILANMMRMI